jgi:hypothetical protein
MPVMRDITKTAAVGRPRCLPKIPLGYAFGDRTYLLHSIFWRDVTYRTDLRYGEPISRDDDRLAGLYTVDKLRQTRFCISQADSLIHKTSLS